MTTAITFHKLALGPVLQGLKNAHAFISKGQAHAAAQGHDENDYTTARLHPDMLDLVSQVNRFTDSAKFIPTRVNPENPTIPLPDVEKTFPELLDRITRTIAYLESIDEQSFEGRETAPYTSHFGQGTIKVEWTAIDYVMQFAQPNFWFHVTTAYDILRMKGVDVGKLDFLNGAGLMKLQRVEKAEGRTGA
ncbi:hypothetical protein EK21DRAFT_80058 [Setomelanomma holmii]|uniref:DUF1993 domain-containing protein n=1 Tax=Setomelanomma holmii TaxID=210430 RepID=A0A9P4GXI8_9PLEO|nr:hypothetical protein EK21DRAFT_80058 [Setomelanomma holmii]